MLQDNLKMLRKKAGYQSAKEFANSLNIPYTTYMGYENKGTWPTQENLFKIANKLCVSIDSLLGYDMGFEINKPAQIKRDLYRLGCTIEFLDDYVKLEFRERTFYMNTDDLISKYEKCDEIAWDTYLHVLIDKLFVLLLDTAFTSQSISAFNQNALKMAQKRSIITTNPPTKKSPADDNRQG